MLWKAQFDAEFAEKDSFLGGGAEADDLGFRCVEDLERRLGGAPEDGATVYKKDVADGRESGIRKIGKGSVGISDDSARLRACESAPFKWDRFARLEVTQDFLGGGHKRLTGVCHVSRQDGYDPADLGDRAGLEE
jgi:hypothetical protein